MTEDVSAAGTTIRVQSVMGFHSLTTSSGQIVCIGDIRNERTELLRTSNTTGEFPSPATKTVFLRDSLVFDHPQDTKVTIVDWNRVEFTSASTVTGTKSTLEAYPKPIMPDQPETDHKDTTQTAGYYFTRFNESIDNTYSDYSDPIPWGGFGDNTVATIKDRAVDSLGEEIDGKLITHEFLNQELWQARREYHLSPGKRPFRRVFNADIGDAFTGSYRIDLPTDVERPFTAENVYGVRIGTEANMLYHDKKAHDEYYRGVPHTILTNAYNTGARDLYVVSARDFDESGAVSIEGTSIDYSAKSNSGGTLRISSDGDWNASAGSDVWQNASYGLPDRFTVFATVDGSAYIYFNRPIDTAYIGQNIYADYYRMLLERDSDADTLDEPDFEMYIPRLRHAIKKRKAQGSLPLTDPDYIEWLNRKDQALKNEYLATDIRLNPSVDPLPE